jgi:hypothetical protein
MRKVKHLLMAVVAASTLMVGAMPQAAAAEVTTTAAAALLLPDGTYAVVENGRIIGYITIRNGVIVGSSSPTLQ